MTKICDTHSEFIFKLTRVRDQCSMIHVCIGKRLRVQCVPANGIRCYDELQLLVLSSQKKKKKKTKKVHSNGQDEAGHS